MKKLMTLIGAAAVAFGLQAESLNGYNFDDDEPGPFNFIVDENPPEGEFYWFANNMNFEDIAGTVTAYDPVIPGNLNYLALETGSDPLFRTIDALDINESVTNAQQVAMTSGIVFDQRVKFSAFDSDPTDLSADSKIAVWLKAVDAEDGAPETNLYVSTSILDGYFNRETTNLVLQGVDVLPDTWHQLTITAIPAYNTAGGSIVPGFVIAVDGTVLSVQEKLFPNEDELEVNANMTVAASGLIAQKKLMPSRVVYNAANGQTLIGAGYQGSGAIDSIDIADGNAFEITTNLTVLLPDNVVISGDVVSSNGYKVVKSGDLYTIAMGDKIGVTLAPAPGFRFVGGKDKAQYTFDIDGVTAIAFDDTEAEKDTSTYPVKFINGELIVFSTNVTENTVVLEQPAPAAPEGQSFKGWCETNGEEFVVFDFSNVITNALDLFAKFTNNYYTVTYLTNGVEFATQSVEYGHATTEPDPAPVAPAGQSFDCWLENGVEFSFDTLITNNITLTASFTADAYTLTLTAGANTTLTASPDQATYAYGAAVTLTATADSGYQFSAMPEDWTYVSATELTKDIVITDDTAITGPAATLIPVVNYTVTFDYADGATAVSNVSVASGATVAQPADPTRSGYTFNGWKLYGAAYDFSTAVTSNFTLTAAWTAAGGWDPDPSSGAGKTAGQEYPALAETALASADAEKLTIWAKAKSVAFDDVKDHAGDYVEAFLLNCATDEVAAAKAAFKATITISGSTITVMPPIGKEFNGTLQLKGSTDLRTWNNVEEASSTYQFYKYELGL